MIKIFFLSCLLFWANSTKAYWQQQVNTTIQVSLDDKNHMLHGYEKIVYTNHSPDTLNKIILHLWPNAYKNDRTFFSEQQIAAGKTDFYYADEKDRGFIDSLKFSIDNQLVEFNEYYDNIDISSIDLAKPLYPGDSIVIETPFRVKIPKVFSRLGHINQAYYISQWFPKPAVYDAQGWHPLPYADQGEFYSEFGSYDVSISLPKNYIVMATGNLQNESEKAWIDSLSKIDFPNDSLYNKSFPKSNEVYKTIRFTENNVHDFAWFADKRWIVRKDSISSENNIGTTEIYTAFLPYHQKQWANATSSLKTAIHSYGVSLGPYPYKTIKAVEGQMNAGGGMEYPTITIIDKNSASLLDRVIIHEAGHNWLYGILGTNERANPWMDEGINTFYEVRSMQKIEGTSKNDIAQQLENALYYQLVATNKDQAVNLNATKYLPINYGADVYYKTAQLLELLALNMGEDFEPAMKAYYEAWKFKHPQPEDFRKIMQQHSVKNLSWFFDGALNANKKIDLKIKKVKRNNDSLIAIVENKSATKVPLLISAFRKDSLLKTTTIEPFEAKTSINFGTIDKWTKIKLGAAYTDFKTTNNQYFHRALFPKTMLKIHPLFGLNNSSKNKIFFAPALGYNVYDLLGVGLLWHNISIPQNRFQFAIVPLLSIGSKRVNGVGAIAYSWFPNKLFQEIRLQTNVKSFSQNSTDFNIDKSLYARYFKVAPSLEITFKEANLKSKKQHRILLKQYNISEQYFSYSQNFSIDSLYRPSIETQQNTYALLRYQFSNQQTFHPYSYNLETQVGKGFVKLGLETNKRIDYDIPNKSFYIRMYAGKYISTDNNAINSRYLLNSTYSGTNDYLLDGTYFGRNENTGITASQIAIREGGFKIPTNLYASPIGRSDDWLLSLNLKTDLPFGKIPLRFYADFATFANAKSINPSAHSVLFNAGFELSLFAEALYIYVPILNSQDFSDYLKSMYPTNRFLNSIRFSINLQEFNFMRSNEAVLEKISE